MSTTRSSRSGSRSEDTPTTITPADVEAIVQKAVKAALTDIQALFNSKFADIEKRLLSTEARLHLVEDVNTKLISLDSDLSEKDAIISNLKSEVSTLRDHSSALSSSLMKYENRLDLLETYTRVDNLIIKGLPAAYSEVATTTVTDASADTLQLAAENSDTTMGTVLHFCENILGVPVQPGDISIAHRLPKSKYDTTQPIIVRFTSRRARDSIYNARRNLHTDGSANTKNIYINEHLTKHHDQVFAACRNLRREKKIYSTWTWHGITYAKRTQTSRAMKVLNEAGISKLVS